MCALLRPSPCLVIVLLAPLLSGCIEPGSDGPESPPAPLTSLEVYEYRYDGDDVAYPGYAYGWMARITNHDSVNIPFIVKPVDNLTAFGPATNESWELFDAPAVDILPPGESKLYLFQATFANATNQTGFSVRVIETDQASPDVDAPIQQVGRFLRDLESPATGPNPVGPGQHVHTATVGVWLNGTSFYTNIPDLNADEAFPAGYDRSEFGGDPLPIYVYGEDRTEQPPGSKDTCHFTTITGYNALLKTQVEHGTSVRWLAPEEAYTRPGAEEHQLYGDVLVFMNTIVQHDGGVGPAERAPDPTGDCFRPQNSSPVPLPPPPTLSTTDTKS